MFVYCANNAVYYKDEQGTRPCAATSVQEETAEERSQACQHQNKIARNKKTKSKVLRDITDGAITYYSAVARFYGGWPAFCLVNNTTNFIYYSFLSSGERSLEFNAEKSSYTNTYITRWDRLDYAKHKTKDNYYSFNAWRYNSEYSMHMYGWYLTGWAKEKDIPIVSDWALSFEKADVSPNSLDGRLLVDMATIIFGVLGG